MKLSFPHTLKTFRGTTAVITHPAPHEYHFDITDITGEKCTMIWWEEGHDKYVHIGHKENGNPYTQIEDEVLNEFWRHIDAR